MFVMRAQPNQSQKNVSNILKEQPPLSLSITHPMKKLLLTLPILLCCATALRAQIDTTMTVDEQYATQLLDCYTQAPDFTLTDIHGNPFTLSSLQGHFVVLEFWASWCPDCRKISPYMEQLAAQYDSLGVKFVSVSFDDKRDNWTQYVQEAGLVHAIHVSELKKWKETSISQAYHINWIPSMYILNKKGRILLATVDEKLIGKALSLAVSTDGYMDEIMPSYFGGEAQAMAFIQKNLRYPKTEAKIDRDIRSIVTVMIDKDGSVKDAKTLKSASVALAPCNLPADVQDSLAREMDSEAIRVILSMPRWRAGTNSWGSLLRVKYTIPVRFKYPKP